MRELELRPIADAGVRGLGREAAVASPPVAGPGVESREGD